MKTKFFFAAIAMLCVLSTSAQNNNNGRRQRMNRAEMIQRMAERLAQDMKLSDDKSEAFKVLYIDYQTARQNAASPKGEAENEERVDMNNLTDEKAAELVQKQFATQEAQLKVDKEYYNKFIGIVTPAQVARIFVPQRGGNWQGQRGQGRQRGGRQGGNGNFGGGNF